jgi:hypothetical protein
MSSRGRRGSTEGGEALTALLPSDPEESDEDE